VLDAVFADPDLHDGLLGRCCSKGCGGNGGRLAALGNGDARNASAGVAALLVRTCTRSW
jgi:hypothetical protein